MSINLFKKFSSSNTVKHIYFFLYREINKEIARKQYECMTRCFIRPRRPTDTRVIDSYHMFKCTKTVKYIKYQNKPVRWKKSYVCHNNMKYYHTSTLYRILRQNKYKGRSKLKSKQDMIVALMKM